MAKKRKQSAFASFESVEFVEMEEAQRGPICFEDRAYDIAVCTGRFCGEFLEACKRGQDDKDNNSEG